MKKILIVFFTLLSVSQLQCDNVSWSFPPTIISTSNQNASDPQIAMDSNGNAIATWVENNLIKSSAHPFNMGWNSAATLSSTGASSPRLVSDPNGNATAIWIENGVIKAATKPFNGNWSSSTSLSNSNASTPDLAVLSTGDVVAVWVRNGNIESSTKLFGAANWQNRVTINSTNATLPRVGMGGTENNKRAVVVWQGTSGATNVIYASSKLLTGSWSSQQTISDVTRNSKNAHVALDANSNALAVWYQYDVNGTNYSNVIVRSASMPLNSSWSAPVSLSAAGNYNPANLVAKVAFDSTGNAIALWNTSFDNENFNVQSSVYPLRGSWSTPADLVSSNLFAYQSDLSATTFGDVLAAYMFYNGASLLIQSVESDIDASITTPWSVPINFSAGADNGYPRIAAALSGNVINAATIWITSDGTNNLIAASTGAKTIVLPPSNLFVFQQLNSFNVFNDYFNTLSWDASTDPNVSGYLIFRDGQFIEQVDSSVTQIEDHNRVQNGAVTYGVAAVDSQLGQSQTVFVSFP